MAPSLDRCESAPCLSGPPRAGRAMHSVHLSSLASDLTEPAPLRQSPITSWTLRLWRPDPGALHILGAPQKVLLRERIPDEL